MKLYRLYLLLFSAFVFSGMMHAQSVEPDTLVTVNNAGSVLITRSEGKAALTVRGAGSDKDYYYGYTVEAADDSPGATVESQWDINFPFSPRKSGASSSLRILKNIYAGGLLPVSSADGVKGSWEIGIGEVVGYGWQPSARGPVLSAGIGFGFSELSLNSGSRFDMQGERLVINPVETEGTKASSRFRMWSLKFPLMLTQSLITDKDGDKFGFSIGVILNLNAHASACSESTVGNTRIKQSYSGLHQRIFTTDIMASVGFIDIIGVYVKYCPMRLMRHGYGPEISTISVGGTINF